MEHKFSAKSDFVKFKETFFPHHFRDTFGPHLRGKSLQRWVSVSCAVLVLSIVIICIFTLVTLPNKHENGKSRTRHKVVYSEPSFSTSLLVRKLQLTTQPSLSLSSSSSSSSSSINTLRRSHERPHGKSLKGLHQDDLFISIKTSAQFHHSRLPVILETWFQLAKKNTWFFTDAEDEVTKEATGGHLVVTSCPPDHSRQALSCKMQAEFDMFLQTNKR